MSGHNVEGDYVESLNDDYNYSEVRSECSENSEVSNSDFIEFSDIIAHQHFTVHPGSLKVFMSLCLARYIVSWYGVEDLYSLILNNMVHLICVENGYDISASSFSWIIFNDNSLTNLDFETVIWAYGSNSSYEDFSLKIFLKREIIALDASSGDGNVSDVSEEPGYQEWVSSVSLNLSPIEVEFLNFFKGYSSDDSVDSMASLIPDDHDDQVQEIASTILRRPDVDVSFYANISTNSNGKSLDFFFLDTHKCHFCKRYVCNCWNSYSSIDVIDDDNYDDYSD
ncbi:hypothetical protein F8M41_009945 [Gigaspora margarita]|uniref:Uncharacterized protein n=1 Tax=Gigaspora margarita TaxID=4874 RepID=A0A8H4B456_GIGMA|nr:hypothetical protein F8M41_009945 [Gigaspora margarita]